MNPHMISFMYMIIVYTIHIYILTEVLIINRLICLIKKDGSI